MTQVPPKAGEACGAPGPNLAELKARLQEAEETLDAIRNGEVDAVVVGGASGQQVYTLENADRPYRVLIEQMQEGAVTLSEDGTLLYCNQRFAAIAGVPRETLVGGLLSPFFKENERAAFDQMLSKALSSGVSGEYTLMAAAGTEVPVNVSLIDLTVDDSALRVVCGIVTDLTNVRRRNHELTVANGQLASEIEERCRAEASLQIALDAAGMGSWDLDLLTGVARRSLRHDQIFGYAEMRSDWRLQNALEHFLPDDRVAVAQAFTQAEAIGALEFEGRIKRASDGAIRWVHVRGQTFYDGDKAVRIAGVVYDVTDRHELEEQLRQSQKMEAVGQLTGGLAHDFNNLLTGVTGSLDLIQMRVAQGRTSELDRYLSAAQGAAKRASALTHRLLAFSRRQTLDPRATNVNRLVYDMEDLIRRTVGPAIAVKVAAADDLWNSLVDPPQLENALLNLCINARDAMPGGGRLTIETANKSFDTRMARDRDVSPGQYISLCVSDTGTGMAPDIIERAFDPFFTTKPMGEGTGLGLSMIYGFARQSGGQVRIDSEVGQGSTVCIYLPRHYANAEEADAPTDLLRAPRAEAGETVLIVDDEPTVRMLVTEILGDLGYLAVEANDGASGLKILQSDVRIDLLVTDVGLPNGINGRQLADAARLGRPALKVLFITGYAESAVLNHGHLDPGMHLLTKPFSMENLARRIKELVTGERFA